MPRAETGSGGSSRAFLIDRVRSDLGMRATVTVSHDGPIRLGLTIEPLPVGRNSGGLKTPNLCDVTV
eukprot:745729-Hanusia_phi.AAC.1